MSFVPIDFPIFGSQSATNLHNNVETVSNPEQTGRGTTTSPDNETQAAPKRGQVSNSPSSLSTRLATGTSCSTNSNSACGSSSPSRQQSPTLTSQQLNHAENNNNNNNNNSNPLGLNIDDSDDESATNKLATPNSVTKTAVFTPSPISSSQHSSSSHGIGAATPSSNNDNIGGLVVPAVAATGLLASHYYSNTASQEGQNSVDFASFSKPSIPSIGALSVSGGLATSSCSHNRKLREEVSSSSWSSGAHVLQQVFPTISGLLDKVHSASEFQEHFGQLEPQQQMDLATQLFLRARHNPTSPRQREKTQTFLLASSNTNDSKTDEMTSLPQQTSNFSTSPMAPIAGLPIAASGSVLRQATAAEGEHHFLITPREGEVEVGPTVQNQRSIVTIIPTNIGGDQSPIALHSDNNSNNNSRQSLTTGGSSYNKSHNRNQHSTGSQMEASAQMQSFVSVSVHLPRSERVRNVIAEDAHGYEVLNDYTILDEIGSGASGTVMLAVHSETEEPFAVKAVSKSRKLKFGRALPTFDIEKEVAVMKKLKHPNIVRLHEVIEDPEEHMMYLVMDYVPNGPLFETTTDPVTNSITCNALNNDGILLAHAKQIAEGLRYLHRRKVVHRDIKPDNILLGYEGKVYIADFGVSEVLQRDSDTPMAAKGTPAFFAPEQCRGEALTPASDVWSFGVVLYLAKFGKLPFPGEGSIPSLLKDILESDLTFPDDADPIWKDCLTKLLRKEADTRMSLKSFLKHSLFTGDSLKSSTNKAVSTSLRSAGSSRIGGVHSVADQENKDHLEEVLGFDVAKERSPNSTTTTSCLRNSTNSAGGTTTATHALPPANPSRRVVIATPLPTPPHSSEEEDEEEEEEEESPNDVDMDGKKRLVLYFCAKVGTCGVLLKESFTCPPSQGGGVLQPELEPQKSPKPSLSTATTTTG